jgi:hypothetical protein
MPSQVIAFTCPSVCGLARAPRSGVGRRWRRRSGIRLRWQAGLVVAGFSDSELYLPARILSLMATILAGTSNLEGADPDALSFAGAAS